VLLIYFRFNACAIVKCQIKATYLITYLLIAGPVCTYVMCMTASAGGRGLVSGCSSSEPAQLPSSAARVTASAALASINACRAACFMKQLNVVVFSANAVRYADIFSIIIIFIIVIIRSLATALENTAPAACISFHRNATLIKNLTCLFGFLYATFGVSESVVTLAISRTVSEIRRLIR